MLIMCNVIMILYDAAVEISSCSVRKLVDPPQQVALHGIWEVWD